MHRTLGIDLGTTNSVTAWLSDGVPVVLPNQDGDQATPRPSASTTSAACWSGMRPSSGVVGLPGP